MTNSRRNFIRNTAFAAAGVMVVKPNLFAAAKPQHIIVFNFILFVLT